MLFLKEGGRVYRLLLICLKYIIINISQNKQVILHIHLYCTVCSFLSFFLNKRVAKLGPEYKNEFVFFAFFVTEGLYKFSDAVQLGVRTSRLQ